jgi:hypothetical protein
VEVALRGYADRVSCDRGASIEGEEPEEAEGLPTGAGAPEAVTEQPDLRFEHHPEAKWLGDPFGLRLLAVALTARKRRHRDEHLATPWVPIALTIAVVIVALAMTWLIAWMIFGR